MTISVVILNWNRPRDTIAAVESVLKQKYDAVEIVIWDNASSDDSVHQLTSLFGTNPRVRIEASPENYGVAGGRNRAFLQSSGEIIFSLDSDATIETPDAFTKIIAAFDADPKLGALSFEVKRPDGHLMWPFARPATAWRNKTFETIRVDGCAFAIRKQVFNDVGGFAEHFSPYGVEDRYLAHQVIGSGYKVLYDPGISIIHAQGPVGRNKRQFMFHTRNHLWMTLELFPMPTAFLSFFKIACALFRDALEERRVLEFFCGFAKAVTGFKPSRRKPMPKTRWLYLRQLISEDKKLANATAS